ncbi:MAG: hypothetical protein LBO05_09835 [Deltaproteobacteria bacterium]|nr:hypothetical protein [Deltaproteobacteria bacterium]
MSTETFHADDYPRRGLPLRAPAYSVGEEKSRRGPPQFVLSPGSSRPAVGGLKSAVAKKRPDHKPGGKKRSFPSGRAAAGLTGGMFIHKRRGLRAAVVPRAPSVFMAGARPGRNKRDAAGVLGPLAVSGILALIFVDKYEGGAGGDNFHASSGGGFANNSRGTFKCLGGASHEDRTFLVSFRRDFWR